MKQLPVLLVLLGATLVADEPPARRPAALPLTFPTLAHVTAVAELPDGRLLVTDKSGPALLAVDPKSGTSAPVGSPGLGEGRYIEPGGIYGGAGLPLRIADQGQMKSLLVTPAGTIGTGTRYAPAGTSASSSADRDLYLIDGRGRSYVVDRMAAAQTPGGQAGRVPLVRYDPSTDTRQVITTLLPRESQSIPGGDGVTFTRSVIGSPEDGWGVAADGRVAVVRARPYRVDWYSPAGVESKGPEHVYDVLPMTQADKDAFTKMFSNAGNVASVGVVGGGASSGRPAPLFSDTKPAFDADGIVVSPAGRVWVPRSAPITATTITYDVFDTAGQRVTRIELPAGSRIVGFGVSAIYARQPSGSGVTVKKYEVK